MLHCDTESRKTLHFYVLARNKMELGNYKVGYHTGNKDMLIKRYVTSLPEVNIIFFKPMSRAKECEKMLLILLDGCRVTNLKERQSEWIQCEEDRLLTCVRQIEYLLNETQDLQMNVVAKESKKRKRRIPETLGNNDAQNFGGKIQKQTATPKAIISIATSPFHDPKVRELFLDHLMNIQVSEPFHVPREFLEQFILLLFPKMEYLQSLPDPNFPISAHVAAQVFKIKVQDFSRIIDPTPSDLKRKSQRRVSEFVEGRDFLKGKRRKTEKGGVTRPFYMTIACFKKASMAMRSNHGRMIREYFNRVSQGYETYMGEDLWERLKDQT